MVRKFMLSLTAIIIFSFLVACGDDQTDDEYGGLVPLEVAFTVPEKVAAGETVELHAFVTYGDEDVTDARVRFEVWEIDDKENSELLDGNNHKDGSYTVEYTFEKAGTYEMYAHTDAHDLHTMPKKQIIVE